MSGELHELSVRIGGIEKGLRILERTVRDNQEQATEEHRKVHDIVVATSEAVRNLAKDVAEMKPRADAVPGMKSKIDEMKPLTDDYREKRAEARGAAKLAYTLYAVIGGMIGSAATWLIQIVSLKPPHQ